MSDPTSPNNNNHPPISQTPPPPPLDLALSFPPIHRQPDPDHDAAAILHHAFSTAVSEDGEDEEDGDHPEFNFDLQQHDVLRQLQEQLGLLAHQETHTHEEDQQGEEGEDDEAALMAADIFRNTVPEELLRALQAAASQQQEQQEANEEGGEGVAAEEQQEEQAVDPTGSVPAVQEGQADDEQIAEGESSGQHQAEVDAVNNLNPETAESMMNSISAFLEQFNSSEMTMDLLNQHLGHEEVEAEAEGSGMQVEQEGEAVAMDVEEPEEAGQAEMDLGGEGAGGQQGDMLDLDLDLGDGEDHDPLLDEALRMLEDQGVVDMLQRAAAATVDDTEAAEQVQQHEEEMVDVVEEDDGGEMPMDLDVLSPEMGPSVTQSMQFPIGEVGQVTVQIPQAADQSEPQMSITPSPSISADPITSISTPPIQPQPEPAPEPSIPTIEDNIPSDLPLQAQPPLPPGFRPPPRVIRPPSPVPEILRVPMRSKSPVSAGESASTSGSLKGSGYVGAVASGSGTGNGSGGGSGTSSAGRPGSASGTTSQSIAVNAVPQSAASPHAGQIGSPRRASSGETVLRGRSHSASKSKSPQKEAEQTAMGSGSTIGLGVSAAKKGKARARSELSASPGRPGSADGRRSSVDGDDPAHPTKRRKISGHEQGQRSVSNGSGDANLDERIQADQPNGNVNRRESNDGLADMDEETLNQFASYMDIQIPGLMQNQTGGDDEVEGEEGEGGTGKQLSQAQIDAIVASLGRPPPIPPQPDTPDSPSTPIPDKRPTWVHLTNLNDRDYTPSPGQNSLAPTSRAASEVREQPAGTAAEQQEAIVLNGEGGEAMQVDPPREMDPAAQAQELLAMISALLPSRPGEDGGDDDDPDEDDADGERDNEADQEEPEVGPALASQPTTPRPLHIALEGAMTPTSSVAGSPAKVKKEKGEKKQKDKLDKPPKKKKPKDKDKDKDKDKENKKEKKKKQKELLREAEGAMSTGEGGDSTTETPRQKKERKKRNRLVLSCTECHRRCDRNIPCARCIKRGVPELCFMEAPPLSEKRRKRDNALLLAAMNTPGFDWTARVKALEDLMRTNPTAFANLELAPNLVNGIPSGIQLSFPDADEVQLQNQLQAVLTLISQAQTTQDLEVITEVNSPTTAKVEVSDEQRAEQSGPEVVESMIPRAIVLRRASPPPPSAPAAEKTPSDAPDTVLQATPVDGAPDTPVEGSLPVDAPVEGGLPQATQAGKDGQPSEAESAVDSVPRSVEKPAETAPESVSASDVQPAQAVSAPAEGTPPQPILDESALTAALETSSSIEAVPAAQESSKTSAPVPIQPQSSSNETDSPLVAPGEKADSAPVATPTEQPLSVPVDDGPPEGPSETAADATAEPQTSVTTSAEQDDDMDAGGFPDGDITPEAAVDGPSAIAQEPVADDNADVRPADDTADARPIEPEPEPAKAAEPEQPQAAEETAPLLPQINGNHRRGSPPPLNIPANLQAELEKLTRGISDLPGNETEEADHDPEQDVEVTDVDMVDLSDPNALFAQLASTLSGPLAIQSSQDNAILMDMLAQLTNGQPQSPTVSALSNVLANPPQTPPLTELWSQVPSADPDTLTQVMLAHRSDLAPEKLNLALPGFREDDSRIFVPPTARQVERQLHMKGGVSHEALPIEGYAPFIECGLKLGYGKDGTAFKEGRVAAIQATTLTGAMRIGAAFLARHPAQNTQKTIYVPDPTHEEELAILREAGLDVQPYRFLDRQSGTIDWDGMRDDLQSAPSQSIILLRASGSVPTGVEMTTAHWRLTTEIIAERHHIPFFVMEFQGLSTGNVDRDAQPLRFMAHRRIPLVVAQNFDAALGLYSDSPSIVSVVANTSTDKIRIESQLKSIARSMYSHPSPWGAHVAANILGTPAVYKNWLTEIKAMADRLKSIREKLFDHLTNKLKTPGNWTHLRRGTGMYCCTLLSPEQVNALAYREHIHLLPNGCFSLGCLNSAKIEQLARGIDNIVRNPTTEDDDIAAEAAMQIRMALQQGFGPDSGF